MRNQSEIKTACAVKLTLLLLFLAVRCVSQSSVASGELHGTLTDPSGTVIPGVRAELTSPAIGLSRIAVTDVSGQYRFPQLYPGEYDLQFDKKSFQTHVVKRVRVTVGQIAIFDTILEVSMEEGPSFRVEVIGGLPALIETQRSHQANTLEEQSIRDLPINRRDYLSFTLLAPGVVDATALADNADFRVKQTPHSGLSFYGSNGRGNSVTVDGGEANDSMGGVRPTVSQETVQEFQINRSNYSAEVGGASGGVINIITKHGTNETHGSLFGFFRHRSLDAGDPFARALDQGELVRVKPPSNRQQFGATLGMPLRKNKTFLFAGGEGFIRSESAVVSLLTDRSIFQPGEAQEAALEMLSPDVAGPLRTALTSPPSTIELFEHNSGVFPFPTHDWKFSVRFDHYTNDRGQFVFRHNYSHVRERNGNVQALVGASRGNELDVLDVTSLVGWTQTFESGFTNEARAQWNYRRFNIDSVEKFGPEIRIAGFGVFNHDWILPSGTIERRYEVKDNLSYARGDHILKLGGQVLVRGNHFENHTFFSGRFTFGDLPASVLGVPGLPPALTISALQAFNLGLATTFIYGTGNPIVASTEPFYGFYVQDSWRLRKDLTLDFGLRYELDVRKSPVPTDKNNFAPRLSFAWDPFNDKKTVVRGGYGVFYSPLYYQVDAISTTLGEIDGRREVAQLFTTIGDPGAANAANIFSSLRAQGIIGVPNPARRITAGDLAQFGVKFDTAGPLPPLAIIFGNSPDFVSPYAQQSSLAVEHQFGSDFTISAAYTFVRTLKITRMRDVNLLPAPLDREIGIRVWCNPLLSACDPARDFVEPLLAHRNIVESTGRAFYSGMIVELKKRFGDKLTVNANYTLSRATDEVTDYSLDYEAFDQTDLRGERGLSSFHQRHKIVAYGSWRMPNGIQLSPIFRANSGRPFNLLAGFDLNQDRHDTTDRPAFAGRNIGHGPSFWTLDLRVHREFAIGESSNIELMAESFNIFNHLNLASVNNVVGNMAPPFEVRGRHDRGPSEPLGFSSAFEARRIQLGVRIRF